MSSREDLDDSPGDSGDPLDPQREKQGSLGLLFPFLLKWVQSKGQHSNTGCEQTAALNLNLVEPAALLLTTNGALGEQGA